MLGAKGDILARDELEEMLCSEHHGKYLAVQLS